MLLQACKTSVGHTEPAAGAVGLLHALAAIHTQAASGILHLRTVWKRERGGGNAFVHQSPHHPHTQVNPHIQPASMERMVAPRQPAPFVQRFAGAAVGVSAFAFQGTNAHALLCAPSQEAGRPLHDHTNSHWQHQEVNVAPQQHPLLREVAVSLLSVTFACALDHPSNSFLWQHVVGGQPLLPATAYLEAMHAALGSAGQAAILQDVAFKRPVLLDADNARLLQVRLQVDSGALEVACGSAVHATACAGSLSTSSHVATRWALLALEGGACANGVADVALQPDAAAMFALHPAALDSVLQLAAACQRPEHLSSTPSVPASLAGYAPQASLKATFHAVTSTRPATRGGATSSYRALGGLCALTDLVSLPLAAPKQEAVAQTGMYALAWLTQEQQQEDLLPLVELQPFDTTATLAAVQGALPAGWVGANLPPASAGLLRSAGGELGPCGMASTSSRVASLLLVDDTAAGDTDGYGPRVGAATSRVAVLRRAAQAQPLRYQLCPQPRGALHNLVAVLMGDASSLPMLHVQATGINFRDVLNVLVRCFDSEQKEVGQLKPTLHRACTRGILEPLAATARAWSQAVQPPARACLAWLLAAWALQRPLRP